MKGALGIQMNRIIEVILHAVDLLLLTVRVAVLTLARRVRIAQATPPGAFRRPPSDNFEGILVNHRGHVRRVAPAYWPHTNPFKSSNLFQQKEFHPMTALNPGPFNGRREFQQE
jgi:hypothetical protein